ncbi:sigma-54-dependent Fis family transcriptional regulator [Rhodopseudomonas palustris]|uniref:Sigma54 specific transcriptional regulator with GAF sensor, Fis family n=1 Tax=Rhodopseudomonas palustris (strain BisB18) TaxID=316056 RepID=Q217B6_RHOPB
MTDARNPGDAAGRHARRLLNRGEIPPPGLLNTTVSRSWERCLKSGLEPLAGPATPDPVSPPQLKQALEQRREWLRQARPIVEYLYSQVSGSGSMVILADDQGLLIEALGDAEFLKRAERVALQPGACWHEQDRGTNAIGTALAERAPVAVHGSEHFLDCNRFLTCTAAPVMGSDGKLLGVIDISGHHSARHPHTLGLVQIASHMIESRVFELWHEGATRLRLHPQAEGIGTLADGLLALDEDGRIVGANRTALNLLGLADIEIGHVGIDGVLALASDGLLQQARRHPGAVLNAETRSGRRLFVRAEPGRSLAPSALPRRTAPARDALAELDTGDERMRQCLERARKVVGKPIPILLQGESGVGKELVAAAIHASGPRQKRAMVAVNCAALPEHLIEAELFGYAPGAFTGARREGSPGRIREADGGTLFLDEIGDMPLSLQSRLLRVLQERQVVPLGGGKPTTVDFALIAASHRPLKLEVEHGRFRADLYYRLNGITLTLPSLRTRSDFPVLMSRLLERFEPGAGLLVEPSVVAALAEYSWPGNLRELANVLRFASALLDPGETVIGWQHLPEDLVDELRRPQRARPDNCAGLPSLRAASDSLIERALHNSAGNLSEAARRLGISRTTLYRRIGGDHRRSVRVSREVP